MVVVEAVVVAAMQQVVANITCAVHAAVARRKARSGAVVASR